MLTADEKILYDCYRKIMTFKNRKMDIRKDKASIVGINNNIEALLTKLSSDEKAIDELEKLLIHAKGMYFQFAAVDASNPSCITVDLRIKMDCLIAIVCKHEAEMIKRIRINQVRGCSIDIEGIFAQKKYANCLGKSLASTIVLQAMKEGVNCMGYVPTFYITHTGAKFHREDCPYCKGRNLLATTFSTIKEQNLKPCKCLTEFGITDEADCNHVTAFVDESLRTILCGEMDNNDKAASYSYIICYGQLTNESQINSSLVMSQGVEFSNENIHTERITESAIGKVLISLAYDYEFSGQVHIYTDNQAAVEHWTDIALNRKLVQHFESVDVSYISREENTMADQLGRTRILLNMSADSYNKLIDKCERVNELENKVSELESEKKILAEMNEAANELRSIEATAHNILAKRLRINSILRYIRNYFGKMVVKKAIDIC